MFPIEWYLPPWPSLGITGAWEDLALPFKFWVGGGVLLSRLAWIFPVWLFVDYLFATDPQVENAAEIGLFTLLTVMASAPVASSLLFWGLVIFGGPEVLRNLVQAGRKRHADRIRQRLYAAENERRALAQAAAEIEHLLAESDL